MKPIHTILMLGALLTVATGCAKKAAETANTTPPADTAAAVTPAEIPASKDAPEEKGKAEEAITPAATASGVWQQIDAEQTKLASVISSGSLADVHRHAFAIRDLVAALPRVSSGLAAAESASLAAGVKDIAKEADDLDKSGDAGDLSATQAGATAMGASLAKLRSITRGVK